MPRRSSCRQRLERFSFRCVLLDLQEPSLCTRDVGNRFPVLFMSLIVMVAPGKVWVTLMGKREGT
jgi:hypothetical protein